MGPGRLLQFLACDSRLLCSDSVSLGKALQVLRELKKLKKAENIENLQNDENIERNRKKGLTGICLRENSGRPCFLKN